MCEVVDDKHLNEAINYIAAMRIVEDLYPGEPGEIDDALKYLMIYTNYKHIENNAIFELFEYLQNASEKIDEVFQILKKEADEHTAEAFNVKYSKGISEMIEESHDCEIMKCISEFWHISSEEIERCGIEIGLTEEERKRVDELVDRLYKNKKS